jgi:ABC-type glycerol-3-phosphate transport system substrate-binding protein
MNSYQEKGYLTDMTQYASAAGFDPKSVYGDIYSGANQNGMYGIPYRMAVWFMFYNKTMLDDLGITVQTDKSYTWDEYADLCIKTEDALKAAGKDIGSDPNNGCYAGLVGMNKEMTIQQRGARFDDQDTSAITEMWDIWHKLDTDGTHVPYAEKLQYSTNAGKVFWTTGRVAFFQNATWGIANYNKDPADGGCDFDYRCMKMPVPDGVKDNTNPANPNYFGIPVTSSHPEQAYEFIQWACTNGGAKILAESSVLPAYADDEVTSTYTENAKQKDDVLGQIISSPNNCLTDLCFPGYSEVLSAYEEQMESYMVGNETEDEALANFVSKRDEILKAQ